MTTFESPSPAPEPPAEPADEIANTPIYAQLLDEILVRWETPTPGVPTPDGSE